MSDDLFKECERCKTPLRVIRVNGEDVALEQATTERHVCWDLPQDANLLVIDD